MRSLFIFIVCFLATTIIGQQNEQAICRKRDSSVARWTCKLIADCELSEKLLGTPQEYRCSSDKRFAKICCPVRVNATKTTTSTRLKASPLATSIQIINEKCTEYAKARYRNVCLGGDVFGQEESCTIALDCRQKTETLIVHGKQVEDKEFPHMALVGYGKELSDVEWNCGGSLISERFVLTAAHCAQTSKPASWIGLGLLSRESYTPDVLNANIFPITKVHVHPGYKLPHQNNDIALFELKNRIVEFSAYIRPVCLHTDPNIPPEAQKNATIIGWGKTAAGSVESDALLKGTIAILSTDSCKKLYASERSLQNGFDGKTMICAGDTKTKVVGSFQDTCQGDSGGPIQMNHKEECMYLQAGITSMGSDFCGGGAPAIYTRIYPYLEWIQRIVWPQKGSRV